MLILGGGLTGLSLGYLTGLPVFEARREAGGICSSYYMRPGSEAILSRPPRDDEVYRFEIGGGHWLWSREPAILDFVASFTPVKRYQRRSAVYFPGADRWVPYPIQYHLSHLGPDVAQAVLEEMLTAGSKRIHTMYDWLREHFGETLTRLFFEPHNRLYTAGLLYEMAPQDAYKSPVDLRAVVRGALGNPCADGYNATFVYPERGLDALVRGLAASCDVRYGKRAVSIDVHARRVHFEDGTSAKYEQLLSTLPLNVMLQLTGLPLDEEPDPYTSVLVLNLGAERGPKFPDVQWLYVPESRSGFHRVGFYSNVDEHFLPWSYRGQNSHGALYVERAFPGGQSRPTEAELRAYEEEVIRELQEWGFIGEVEVSSSNWIEVGYCWRRPRSRWKEKAIELLRTHNIHQVGRFALWTTQGIADSVQQAFVLAGSMAPRLRAGWVSRYGRPGWARGAGLLHAAEAEVAAGN